MNKLRLTLVLIIIITLGLSAASLLLPEPPGAGAREFYNPLATSITLIDMGLSIGAAWLFFRARRNFKPELRPTYRLLAAATFVTGVLNVIFPINEYYGLWEIFFFNMASYFPYLAGGILMYLGIRELNKVIGTKQWLTNIPLMIGLTLVLWIIYIQTPHLASSWPSETAHDGMQLIVLIPVVLHIAAVLIAVRFRQRLGREYRTAFGWLTVSLLVYLVDVVMVMVLEIIGYDNWFFNTRAYEIPIILADIMVLITGYYFNKVGLLSEARVNWLQRLLGHQPQPASSIDIIVYAAGLAADPSKIDEPLNKMRAITALMVPGQPRALTETEQQTLKEVYVAVEQYLVDLDPLRVYEKAKLRDNITTRFELDQNATQTFWPLLAA